MPKAVPERAVTAMLGRYVSRIEKVAAPVKAIRATSSNLRRFWGITKAAIATTPKFIILNKKKKN
jgi:hypothetical protein